MELSEAAMLRTGGGGRQQPPPLPAMMVVQKMIHGLVRRISGINERFKTKSTYDS